MPSRLNRLLRLIDSPYLLLSLAALFWSSNFILGRAVRAEIPPVSLAFLRWILAGLLLAPIAWPHLRRDLPLLRRKWPLMLLLAFLGVTAFDALNYLALRSTQAIDALLLQSTIPVLIVGFSFMIFGDRIRASQWVGICLSLAGAISIITEGNPGRLVELGANTGTLLAFTAVLSYSAYLSLLGRRPDLHPLSFLLALIAMGTAMLSPFFVWEVLSEPLIQLSAAAVMSLAYLALGPSLVAYLLYIRGVERIGANRAGVFIHLMPLFGSLMAVALLGESFRLFHALGLTLILAGVALAGVARAPSSCRR